MYETLDIGCGYLNDHKRRSGVGLDIQKGTCDVVGDIHFLPFKNGAFSFVYARNILEHLEDPIKALNELKRVMKVKAKISITIPIHHNPPVDEIIKILCCFPFRVLRSFVRLKRWRKNRFKKGFWHLNRIKPFHIEKFFKINVFASLYPKFRIVGHLGIFEISPFPDVYYIYGEKKE